MKFSFRIVSKHTTWIASAGLFCGLLLVWQVSVANESTNLNVVASASAPALEKRLAAVDGLRGKFEQTLTDAYGRTLERSKGVILLKKPQLRWETTAPFPQVIAVDAELIRIYDPDLEQVTQRAVSERVTEIPLLLLTQKNVTLEDTFNVTMGSDNPEQPVFVLIPHSDEALFDRIEVQFAAQLLRSIRIFDHLGQQTSIDLTELESGIVIPNAAFELDLPAGTDIVEG